MAGPSRRALIGGVVVLTISTVLLPFWLLDWWNSIQQPRVNLSELSFTADDVHQIVEQGRRDPQQVLPLDRAA
jgi:hypothetical protein